MKSQRQAVIGIIMLNTQFPRFPGDIGNPDSFASLNVKTVYERVSLATVANVVTGDGIKPEIAEQLLNAATRFGKVPVDQVLTSCGYLGELQAPLQRAAGVPVVSSSIAVLPFLKSIYGNDSRLGVMTFDSRRLKAHHLLLQSPLVQQNLQQSPKQSQSQQATGIEHLIVHGMESSPAFYHMIADDELHTQLQPLHERLQQEVVEVAERFRTVSISALILECTNLSPFKNEIREATGVPVFDIFDVSRFLLEARPD